MWGEMNQIHLDGSTDISWWEAGHGRQVYIAQQELSSRGRVLDSPPAGSTDQVANSKLKLSEGQDTAAQSCFHGMNGRCMKSSSLTLQGKQRQMQGIPVLTCFSFWRAENGNLSLKNTKINHLSSNDLANLFCCSDLRNLVSLPGNKII